ncbi:MAG: helix-hairpin-helix domain-containing protein [Bacilli bacterium]|nr:helix-hairpin-helix domain-containing protein [Bacilli bacterium]
MTDLLKIPGVGKSIKQDFIDMGYQNVEMLKDKNPEFLYQKLCVLKGGPVDRCMLYVFRCAVYYANTEKKDPALLKWQNWKEV